MTRRRRRPRRLAAIAAAALAGAVPSACGGSATAAPTTVVATRTLAAVGPILTTGDGLTLYMFPPDDARRVSCTGDCARDWPPLQLPTGARLGGGGEVRAALLATVADPAGGRPVITYDGWPLYRFHGDTRPGDVHGQGLDDAGGRWYVMSPDGAPLTVAISPAGPAAPDGEPEGD